MAWYGGGGWDYYPPYVSVGGKRGNGARALAKLLKKSKRPAEPVVIAHRKRRLTTTFWGQGGGDNLERYAALANRLPRGGAHPREGPACASTSPRSSTEWASVSTPGRSCSSSYARWTRRSCSARPPPARCRARARRRASASPTIGFRRCSGSNWRTRRRGARVVWALAEARGDSWGMR